MAADIDQWRSHLEAIAREGISIQAYGKREGVGQR